MLSMNSKFRVAAVSRKGQVTIPRGLREKYGIGNKALVEEAESGVLLKRLPSPDEDMGSLKPFFKGKTARQLLREARKEEFSE